MPPRSDWTSASSSWKFVCAAAKSAALYPVVSSPDVEYERLPICVLSLPKSVVSEQYEPRIASVEPGQRGSEALGSEGGWTVHFLLSAYAAIALTAPCSPVVAGRSPMLSLLRIVVVKEVGAA